MDIDKILLYMMGGMFIMYAVCFGLVSLGVTPPSDQATTIDVGFVGTGAFLLIIRNSIDIKRHNEEIKKGKL